MPNYPGKSDTSVVGPYSSFKLIASYRIFERDYRRFAVYEINERIKEADKLRAALRSCRETVKANEETILLLKESIGTYQEANILLSEKNAKLRQWATIGKVSVCLTSIVVVGVVADKLIN